MSPLYDNHFAGHFESADPRTPLHGAGGCVFPTVPAMRYCLRSNNATGLMAILNYTGILVIRPVVTLDMDFYQYQPVAPPPPFGVTRCVKVYNPVTEGYRWEVNINMGSGVCPMEWRIEKPFSACNVDVLLGARSCPGGIPPGSTGSTFTMYQVEYDGTCPLPPP
ncbi:MAG: hypothetical protein KAR39_13185 [Thermoplasmata archaeon]|nr:hypothetical protein [Thermoplasmata archaeon]